MSLTRFLILSVIAGCALFIAVLMVIRAADIAVPMSTLVASAVCGVAVSTMGWTVVRLGFRDRPERIIGYFGAAVILKLFLLVSISGFVMVEGSMDLGEFLIPFAAVFLLLGFAQLAVTVKEAARRLEASTAVTPDGGVAESGTPMSD